MQRLVPRSHRQRGKASSSSFSPWVSYSGLDAVVITMMSPQRHRQLMRVWGFSLETWGTSESRGFLTMEESQSLEDLRFWNICMVLTK